MPSSRRRRKHRFRGTISMSAVKTFIEGFTLCTVALASAQTPPPRLASVRVAEGQLAGVPAADASVTVFKGVPFAAPPVGDLRWRAPQPAAPWTGVRKAD